MTTLSALPLRPTIRDGVRASSELAASPETIITGARSLSRKLLTGGDLAHYTAQVNRDLSRVGFPAELRGRLVIDIRCAKHSPSSQSVAGYVFPLLVADRIVAVLTERGPMELDALAVEVADQLHDDPQLIVYEGVRKAALRIITWTHLRDDRIAYEGTGPLNSIPLGPVSLAS